MSPKYDIEIEWRFFFCDAKARPQIFKRASLRRGHAAFTAHVATNMSQMLGRLSHVSIGQKPPPGRQPSPRAYEKNVPSTGEDAEA